SDSRADIKVLPIEPAIIDSIEHIHRESVPDLPDRIIAATALHRGLPLVTRDRQLRESEVETIW
ncbi:MAG: PIN domain-containing protein, partial [Candidatus Omnitrophica bacterium]|nr:PIN domain-containing protein [Candidatus Omnitrophota bacterium]